MSEIPSRQKPVPFFPLPLRSLGTRNSIGAGISTSFDASKGPSAGAQPGREVREAVPSTGTAEDGWGQASSCCCPCLSFSPVPQTGSVSRLLLCSAHCRTQAPQLPRCSWGLRLQLPLHADKTSTHGRRAFPFQRRVAIKHPLPMQPSAQAGNSRPEPQPKLLFFSCLWCLWFSI